MSKNELQRLIPGMDTLLLREIIEKSKEVEVPADTLLLDAGNYVHAVPLVTEGLVRVSRRDGDRELLLYHIYPGEICIMSFSACCSMSESLIVASAAENSTLLLLPAEQLRSWLRTFPSLNEYVYKLYHSRYMDLINTINQLIFYNLDERLYKYLRDLSAASGNQLLITHQQIANDLGTAREVVSRLMKKLEKEGRIEQGRNLVRMLS